MRTNSLIIFFLVSFQNAFAQDFWEELKSRTYAAENISFSRYVRLGEPIRSPLGATVLLAEVILLNRKFQRTKDCLIFKVPSPTQKGILTLHNVHPADSCEPPLEENTKILELKNLYNIAFEYSAGTLVIINEKERYIFPFYNYKFDKKKNLLETSVSNKKVPGVAVSYVISQKFENLKNNDICFDVNDKCEEVVADKCDYCPGAILPVIASNCESKVRRYCSNALCGTKGQPACLRGRKASGYTGPYCINDSPLGYCEKPLRVICYNNELVCR